MEGQRFPLTKTDFSYGSKVVYYEKFTKNSSIFHRGVGIADGRTVKFTHNSAGNRISMEDHRGFTLFEYNPFGKLLKTIFPDGTTLK